MNSKSFILGKQIILKLYVIKCQDVDKVYNVFYRIILDIINNLVPRKIFVKFNYLRWFSSKLKSLLHSKCVAHIAYKQSNENNDIPVEMHLGSILRTRVL